MSLGTPIRARKIEDGRCVNTIVCVKLAKKHPALELLGIEAAHTLTLPKRLASDAAAIIETAESVWDTKKIVPRMPSSTLNLD